MKNLYLIFFVFILTYACKEKKYQEELTKFRYFLAPDTTLPKVTLIIPLQGCSGCVHACLDFAKKYQSERHIKFIICNGSRKEINLKLKAFEINVRWSQKSGHETCLT
jgi:hypothetical protein